MTRAALVLVDLQRDFLEREDLEPPAEELASAVALFLGAARALGLPVAHVQTLVRADSSDRMPHWVAAGYCGCVAGTEGALPPAALAPAAGETVIHKRYFSAFGDAALTEFLTAEAIDTVVLAGVHLHGCVRATAFDAYERGYRVWIADDLVGSYDPLQAAAARAYLAGRAATLLPAAQILERLGAAPRMSTPLAQVLPVACIGHRWQEAVGASGTTHRDPSCSARVIAHVPYAGSAAVAAAAQAAAQAQIAWARLDPGRRLELLRVLEALLVQRRGDLEALLAAEIGKPLRNAREELTLALAHLAAARELPLEESVARGISVRYRPVGSVALITPWNNPVAIPLGKLAPALFYGNTVVWKPSPLAPRTAMAVMEALIEAGFPPGVVNLLCGDGRTAAELIAAAPIARVALTGSAAAGRGAAALCALHGKPLQAELGGTAH